MGMNTITDKVFEESRANDDLFQGLGLRHFQAGESSQSLDEVALLVVC